MGLCNKLAEYPWCDSRLQRQAKTPTVHDDTLSSIRPAATIETDQASVQLEMQRVRAILKRPEHIWDIRMVHRLTRLIFDQILF